MRGQEMLIQYARHCRAMVALLAIAACLALPLAAAEAAKLTTAQGDGRNGPRDLFVVAGKSIVVQTPSVIQRVVVSDPKIAEALPVTQQELVLHGRAEGETSLILWTAGGGRVLFDLKVQSNNNKMQALVDSVLQEMRQEFPNSEIELHLEGEDPDPKKRTVFVRGIVQDIVGANRAVAMAEVLGKPVNLLRVMTPDAEKQILLKVKFANVERAALQEIGMNLLSTGALGGTIGRVTTGQFSPPLVEVEPEAVRFTLSDALNVFLFRPDLDLGATVRLLQQRRLVEVLAEPNVLAINGKPASFLAGGEFPYPVLQGGGAGLGQITIRFREFGIRINFVPTVTSRGTIRLAVEPEVSSLDFANGLNVQGFIVPALATRRVTTEVELETGQSFVIAGLLDNRVSEDLNKIPGLGDIPLLGKLFQSRKREKVNSELMVLVTPELVRPIAAGGKTPELEFPEPFMEDSATEAKRHPSIEETGPVPLTNNKSPVPVESLREEYDKLSKQRADRDEQRESVLQFIPALTGPAAAPAPAAGGAAAPSGSGGGGQ